MKLIFKVGDEVALLKSSRISNPEFFNLKAIIVNVENEEIDAETEGRGIITCTIWDSQTCFRHLTKLEKILK